MTPAADRLGDKVDKSGGPAACWPWSGWKSRKGYGQISTGRRTDPRVYVHRLAWELANGPVPDGLFVLHRCDNPPCCNPGHLFLGTIADNNRDMTMKGRHGAVVRPERLPRGVGHGNAKLTDDDVRAIRAAWARGGLRQRDIAELYGVDQQVVWSVVHRRTWAHVA